MPGIQRLLMVDDDRALVGVVSAALAEEGYVVTVAHDGRAGLEKFQQEGADLVLLDVLSATCSTTRGCSPRRTRRCGSASHVRAKAS